MQISVITSTLTKLSTALTLTGFAKSHDQHAKNKAFDDPDTKA
jgi:hypothetical protein